MRKQVRALILFGSYLFLAGTLGYLSNPSKAVTAVYSGSLFGFSCILLGLLLQKGKLWALRGGLALVYLLMVVFSWRATVGWIAVFKGHSEKLIAASLISSMLLAALLTLRVLMERKKS